MDIPSELLMRAALHDLANVLAGVRGIIDLTGVDRPLSPRDRDRLEAVIEEGMATLTRSRSLAMDLLPDAALEPGLEWRRELQEQLAPMGTLFRAQVDLAYTGPAQDDFWPGELLRGYVRAASRQVLPYTQQGLLSLRFSASPEAWQVTWLQMTMLPETLLPAQSDKPRDISSRWAARVAEAMGIQLVLEGSSLIASIPRPVI